MGQARALPRTRFSLGVDLTSDTDLAPLQSCPAPGKLCTAPGLAYVGRMECSCVFWFNEKHILGLGGTSLADAAWSLRPTMHSVRISLPRIENRRWLNTISPATIDLSNRLSTSRTYKVYALVTISDTAGYDGMCCLSGCAIRLLRGEAWVVAQISTIVTLERGSPGRNGNATTLGVAEFV